MCSDSTQRYERGVWSYVPASSRATRQLYLPPGRMVRDLYYYCEMACCPCSLSKLLNLNIMLHYSMSMILLTAQASWFGALGPHPLHITGKLTNSSVTTMVFVSA